MDPQVLSDKQSHIHHLYLDVVCRLQEIPSAMTYMDERRKSKKEYIHQHTLMINISVCEIFPNFREKRKKKCK